jgi:hypothetical protein
MTQAGNLLRAAKSLISDPADWTQEGLYVNAQGCLCAQGALNKAFRWSKLNTEVVDDAANYLKVAVSKVRTYRLVTSYNDDPETTHADIMNLFDDAATMADAPTTGE